MAVQPLLVILSALFFVTPLVLAILADRQINSFQQEAFGHLRKASINLRVMVWFIFAFYLAIIVGSLFTGELEHMWQTPFKSTGLWTYVRIGAAIAGYLFALRVTRELYQVTKPRKNVQN